MTFSKSWLVLFSQYSRKLRERVEDRLWSEGMTWSCKETQGRVNMGPTMRLPGIMVAPEDSWPGSQSQTCSLVCCSDIMASCTETRED